MESGQELWDGGLERECKIRNKVGGGKEIFIYGISRFFFL